MNTVIKAVLVAFLAVFTVSACGTTSETNENATSYIHLKTLESFTGGVVGKTLNYPKGSYVIAEDGTWAGVNEGNEMGGTWVWEGEYWCRTIVGGDDDCQQFSMASTFDSVQVTRNMGEGASFVVTLGM